MEKEQKKNVHPVLSGLKLGNPAAIWRNGTDLPAVVSVGGNPAF